jgi:hypothetical protein
VTAWRGVTRIYGQVAGATSREVEPRDEVATAPEPLAVNHGKGMLDDFEAPWMARFVRDLVVQQTESYDLPLFHLDTRHHPTRLHQVERDQFLTDCFYQDMFFTNRLASTTNQLRYWWYVFWHAYSTNFESWHRQLEIIGTPSSTAAWMVLESSIIASRCARSVAAQFAAIKPVRCARHGHLTCSTIFDRSLQTYRGRCSRNTES